MFERQKVLLAACLVTPASQQGLCSRHAGHTRSSLQDGVVKLDDAARTVERLKEELMQLQPLLESKASEVEGLLRQVTGHIVSQPYRVTAISCHSHIVS